MKMLKKGIILLSLIGIMTMLSGCSIGETWDILWGHNEANNNDEETEVPVVTYDPDTVQVDESVSAPTFQLDLEGSSTYAINQPAQVLAVAASATDGGEITYQWYVNTVNSNGGGEPVVGATGTELTPDTSKDGRFYYFVVATHTIDKKMNLATSGIAEVIIDEELVLEDVLAAAEPQEGWQEGEAGWSYIDEEGNAIASQFIEIDSNKYYFNEEHLMQIGWAEIGGQWFYFDEKGIMETGWITEDGKQFGFNEDGTLKTSEWTTGEGYNRWFYSKENGALATGWESIDGSWYYFSPEGVMRYDCEIEGKWLNGDGRLAE
jgi:FOG: Glucan-binding domain (YG repeat)